MERILLKRMLGDDKQTLGIMYKDCKVIAYTLELAWLENKFRISCIPVGIYTVITRTSAKYGKHFHILNVPNRDYILIHHGNYYSDILGCILVGNSHTDINQDGYKDVTSSFNKMKELVKLFPNGFELEIV